MIKTDRQHLMKAQSAKFNQNLFRNFGTRFLPRTGKMIMEAMFAIRHFSKRTFKFM